MKARCVRQLVPALDADDERICRQRACAGTVQRSLVVGRAGDIAERRNCRRKKDKRQKHTLILPK